MKKVFTIRIADGHVYISRGVFQIYFSIKVFNQFLFDNSDWFRCSPGLNYGSRKGKFIHFTKQKDTKQMSLFMVPLADIEAEILSYQLLGE